MPNHQNCLKSAPLILSRDGDRLMDVQAFQIQQLQTQWVRRWHESEFTNDQQGVLHLVCQQHHFNFLLWHQEDIARSPDATDQQIAAVKRAIDRLNQQRNDWIEKIDDWITEALARAGVVCTADARQNSETPGSCIDRLSIVALRLYHLDEHLQQPDVATEVKTSVAQKFAVCQMQQQDLTRSLAELLDDLYNGRKRHRTYRQFKMYNDPKLNPYLNGKQRLSAA